MADSIIQCGVDRPDHLTLLNAALIQSEVTPGCFALSVNIESVPCADRVADVCGQTQLSIEEIIQLIASISPCGTVQFNLATST